MDPDEYWPALIVDAGSADVEVQAVFREERRARSVVEALGAGNYHGKRVDVLER
jgi:hypothetical protein